MTPSAILTMAMLAALLVRSMLYLDLGAVNARIFSFKLTAQRGAMLRGLGGIWFFVIGAPLAAWFLFTFWIGPLLGPQFGGGYNFNINTIIGLSQPIPVLIFLGLWFGIAFGYLAGNRIYRRNGKK